MKKINSKKLSLSRVAVSSLTQATGGAGDNTEGSAPGVSKRTCGATVPASCGCDAGSVDACQPVPTALSGAGGDA